MSEYAGESGVDAHMTTPAGHNGVTFLAASGDDGDSRADGLAAVTTGDQDDPGAALRVTDSL